MKAVTCPAFVIHGQIDDIIPFYHGRRLSEAAPRQHQWPGYFPRGAGHNDIVEANSKKYFDELGSFVHAVLQRIASGAEALPRKPVQVEMTDVSLYGGHEAGAAGNLSFAEPVVGPEDGRYQAMRRGHNPGRGAREMQVVRDGAGEP